MNAARTPSEGTIPIARKPRDPRYVWLDAVRNDPAVKSTEVRLAEVLVREHLNASGRARPSPCNATLAGKIRRTTRTVRKLLHSGTLARHGLCCIAVIGRPNQLSLDLGTLEVFDRDPGSSVPPILGSLSELEKKEGRAGFLPVEPVLKGAEPEASPPPPEAPPAPAAVIPASWVPTSEDRAYGLAAGLGEKETDREAGDFRRWYREKAVRVRSASDAWRRWIDKRAEFDRIDGRPLRLLPAAPSEAATALAERMLWVSQVDPKFPTLSKRYGPRGAPVDRQGGWRFPQEWL